MFRFIFILSILALCSCKSYKRIENEQIQKLNYELTDISDKDIYLKNLQSSFLDKEHYRKSIKDIQNGIIITWTREGSGKEVNYLIFKNSNSFLFLLRNDKAKYVINNNISEKILRAFHNEIDSKHYFLNINNGENHKTFSSFVIVKEGKKLASLTCLEGVFHKKTNLYKENKDLQSLLDIANLCSVYFYKEVDEVN